MILTLMGVYMICTRFLLGPSELNIKNIFANSYKMKGKICRILEEPGISEDGEDVVQAVPSQGNPSSQGSLSS